jgi:DNA-binding IclR family transcriptional regulator
MIENDSTFKIMEALETHPEGLTILDLANEAGINRLTASKYILVLAAEGQILQRKVGSAKLCYKKGKKNECEK